MIHSVWEVIEYASSLVTLQPGDVIGAGTSGGVGMGTSVRGSQVWLVPATKSPRRSIASARCGTRSKRRPLPTAGTGRTCRPLAAIADRVAEPAAAVRERRAEPPGALHLPLLANNATASGSARTAAR